MESGSGDILKSSGDIVNPSTNNSIPKTIPYNHSFGQHSFLLRGSDGQGSSNHMQGLLGIAADDYRGLIEEQSREENTLTRSGCVNSSAMIKIHDSLPDRL